MLFWWWLCSSCKDCNSVAGLFFLFLLLMSLAVCIRSSFGYYVVTEAGCNSYLRDINIYSLSKKNSSPLNDNCLEQFGSSQLERVHCWSSEVAKATRFILSRASMTVITPAALIVQEEALTDLRYIHLCFSSEAPIRSGSTCGCRVASGGRLAMSPVNGWRRRIAVSLSRCSNSRPSTQPRAQWSLKRSSLTRTNVPVSRLKKRTHPWSLP